MEKHTQGRLADFVGNANGRGLVRIEAAHDSSDAGEHVASLTRGEKSEANARRLVACWNACEGIGTAELESGQNVVDRMTKLATTIGNQQRDRDELLAYAECEEARSRGEDIAETVLKRHGFNPAKCTAIEFMDRLRRAAIAKAKGEV